jgi:hypothetical protein
MDDKLNRRSFLQLALMGAVAVPFIAKTAKLFASDACPTTPPAGKSLAQPGEGMGKTLEYVSDATTSKNAKYKTGNNCKNCKFYNAAKADGGYAPCTMLGMKYVTNCGWCKSYSAKV